MLNILNQLLNININYIDNLSITVTTFISLGIAYKVYRSITNSNHINRMRQLEAERTQEGLPNEVTLTPEDFAANPELAEIFEITDVDQNLDLNLQTNDHLDLQEEHNLLLHDENVMTIAEAFVTAIFNYIIS
jgi:hypothetical protein